MDSTLLRRALDVNVLELREVPEKLTNDEVATLPKENQPFLYSSGNWGCGYATIKSLVATLPLLTEMMTELITKFYRRGAQLSFLAGNVTGGVIPGWMMSNMLEMLYSMPVHFFHVSGTRKGSADAKVMFVDKSAVYYAIHEIQKKVSDNGVKADFVAGMTPSGMVPGFCLSTIMGVPFVYIRESRKSGGQQELITGPIANPSIRSGCKGLVIGQLHNFFETSEIGCSILESEGYVGINAAKLINQSEFLHFAGIETPYEQMPLLSGSSGLDVEELVNFAQTTVNSTQALRNRRLSVQSAATILFYDNPEAKKQLAENGIEITYLFTMSELLDAAEKTGKFSSRAVADYRRFLKDPLAWQAERGLTRKKEGGTL